jgi:hypothetical protein
MNVTGFTFKILHGTQAVIVDVKQGCVVKQKLVVGKLGNSLKRHCL